MAKDLRSKDISRITYISIGCVIAGLILFITLFLVLNGRKNKEKIDLQIGENNNSVENVIKDVSSSIGKTVDEVKDYKEINNSESIQVKTTSESQTDNQISETENSNNENNETNSVNHIDTQNEKNKIGETNETSSQPEETQLDPTFVMPVEGEIVKKYGKDKLIYSDTLKEWTTHLGIDIKADKTTIVKSSTDGKIKSIKNDPRYGLTVVIEHANGFSSVYSNLLTAEFVVVGEDVKSGQTIGTVGNSATFEILDDPHLHFEILKDGNSIDPEMYIK
jgi:murein DD-endopeptidase MepM/ murein hydrolase activator NlpD